MDNNGTKKTVNFERSDEWYLEMSELERDCTAAAVSQNRRRSGNRATVRETRSSRYATGGVVAANSTK